MCFFVCLAIPKEDFRGWATLAHDFEVVDVSDWSIGEATCGSRERDISLLVTAGGCSCFISDANHRSVKPARDEFVSLLRSLLQQTPRVAMLIHYAGGDISREEVIRKDKRSVLFDDVSSQLNRLELEVRYIIAN